ncbi:septum formation inhibitor Maf [Zunongwangia endophytica]|uniref:Septum formation inhibitor Maf n=1 Tax=Zunongwangia endophytica TaxID=1808945 RepID=A0ABV8H252_9FLAO|nr:septum formation inhibitor Maf [Zunongwangia endophytica]MDN3594543.1 septum formation inhibitor Maf [Zunongwangia endophytica]
MLKIPKINYPAFAFLCLLLLGCNKIPEPPQERKLSSEFKEYWFDGTAEVTSYHLKQARYGEIREGSAMKIFVKEDFLPEEHVKADEASERTFPILKLNSTKKFTTGIYPYSIMESSFYPLQKEGHATKISASIQEWCGQQFIQLNNRTNFEIQLNSYFENPADKHFNIPKTFLENEIWNLIRVHPKELPVGDLEMIPSFEFLQLDHREAKAYKVTAKRSKDDSLEVYTLQYPKLNRTLKIFFKTEFPHEIEKWEEIKPSGNGEDAKMLTTKALKNKRLKIDYWNKNSQNDVSLREKLGL